MGTLWGKAAWGEAAWEVGVFGTEAGGETAASGGVTGSGANVAWGGFAGAVIGLGRKKSGKTSFAVCHVPQPSRHTNELSPTLFSFSQSQNTEPIAGPYWPPLGGLTYQAALGASEITSGITDVGFAGAEELALPELLAGSVVLVARSLGVRVSLGVDVAFDVTTDATCVR